MIGIIEMLYFIIKETTPFSFECKSELTRIKGACARFLTSDEQWEHYTDIKKICKCFGLISGIFVHMIILGFVGRSSLQPIFIQESVSGRTDSEVNSE